MRAGAAYTGGMYDAATNSCIPLPPYAVRAGPRATIYRDPKQARPAGSAGASPARVTAGSSYAHAAARLRCCAQLGWAAPPSSQG